MKRFNPSKKTVRPAPSTKIIRTTKRPPVKSTTLVSDYVSNKMVADARSSSRKKTVEKFSGRTKRYTYRNEAETRTLMFQVFIAKAHGLSDTDIAKLYDLNNHTVKAYLEKATHFKAYVVNHLTQDWIASMFWMSGNERIQQLQEIVNKTKDDNVKVRALVACHTIEQDMVKIGQSLGVLKEAPKRLEVGSAGEFDNLKDDDIVARIAAEEKEIARLEDREAQTIRQAG